MHHLLKRQLKKTGANVSEEFLELVNQAYIDADEDRNLLERSLEISSKEMKELYEKLQKETQQQLKRTQLRYEKMVQALKDHYFFYAYSVEREFVYLSDSVENILGYSVEEFLTSCTKYLSEDPLNEYAKEATQKAIQGEQQEPYIISIYKKDGSSAYIEVTEFPIFDEQGNVVEVEGIARDITLQYLAQQKLDYISQHDPLTGILNRLSLFHQLEKSIENAHSNQTTLAVLYLDLDHFKEVNDTLGHDVGDTLLKESVKRVQSCIRKDDLFARIGGDEFVVILEQLEKENISHIAQKILAQLTKIFELKGENVNVSVSIGIALYPHDGTDTNTLIKYADEAMYASKESGRNNFTYYESL